jgi:S-adenosylmethionine hydrolase
MITTIGRVIRQLEWRGAVKVANRIQGEIVAVDPFGNLVTNITREMLASVPSDETVAIRCDDHETRNIFANYAEQPPMTLIAVIGSNEQLELAIVDDSAKTMLGVDVGTPVEVRW